MKWIFAYCVSYNLKLSTNPPGELYRMLIYVIQKRDDKEIERVTSNEITALEYKGITDLNGEPMFKVTGFEIDGSERG